MQRDEHAPTHCPSQWEKSSKSLITVRQSQLSEWISCETSRATAQPIRLLFETGWVNARKLALKVDASKSHGLSSLTSR